MPVPRRRPSAVIAAAALGRLAVAALGLPAVVGTAAALELGLPIPCEPGRTCWIPRHVDLDPGPGAKDYACGTLTADGHSGSDFAIRNLAEMEAGVPVVAAAPGVVRGTRDGMADATLEAGNRAAIEGRECGNGVVLAHEGGFETQYCHLRRGSVAVRTGERVERGQRLGLVGLSGETSFPHVHLSVRKDGATVDPFRGLAGGPACGPGAEPLWAPGLEALLDYRPVLVTGLGFAPGRVEWAEVQAGRHDGVALPAGSPALVLWLEAFGLAAGDAIAWRITGPDGGAVFESTAAEARGQARAFRFAGKKAPAEGWPPGSYRGAVTVRRDGREVAAATATVLLR